MHCAIIGTVHGKRYEWGNRYAGDSTYRPQSSMKRYYFCLCRHLCRYRKGLFVHPCLNATRIFLKNRCGFVHDLKEIRLQTGCVLHLYVIILMLALRNFLWQVPMEVRALRRRSYKFSSTKLSAGVSKQTLYWLHTVSKTKAQYYFCFNFQCELNVRGFYKPRVGKRNRSSPIDLKCYKFIK